MAVNDTSSSRSSGKQPGFKDRKSERKPISTKARLTQQNWYSIEVSLCDVSNTGFMAECPENVAIGSYVSLDIPGLGPVRAQVRWQVDGRMGGMFLDPIRLNRGLWTATPVAQGESPASR